MNAIKDVNFSVKMDENEKVALHKPAIPKPAEITVPNLFETMTKIWWKWHEFLPTSFS